MLITASLCSLAAGYYGLLFNCTGGPGCGTLPQPPLLGVSCTTDNVTTSSCSNQQSCDGSLFITDFSATVENNTISISHTVTINGTQFSANVSGSTNPTATPQANPLTKGSRALSKDPSFVTPSFPAFSTSRRSQKFSRAFPRSSYPPKLVQRSGLAATFIEELTKTPQIAQGLLNGLYDASKASSSSSQTPPPFDSVTKAFTAAFQKPIVVITNEVEEGDYKGALVDTTKFVVETSADIALAALASRVGASEIAAAPLVVTAVHVVTDVTVDGVVSLFSDLLGSSAPVTPTPPTSDARPPTPDPAPNSDTTTPQTPPPNLGNNPTPPQAPADPKLDIPLLPDPESYPAPYPIVDPLLGLPPDTTPPTSGPAPLPKPDSNPLPPDPEPYVEPAPYPVVDPISGLPPIVPVDYYPPAPNPVQDNPSPPNSEPHIEPEPYPAPYPVVDPSSDDLPSIEVTGDPDPSFNCC